MLEVLVVQLPDSEQGALPGVSRPAVCLWVTCPHPPPPADTGPRSHCPGQLDACPPAAPGLWVAARAGPVASGGGSPDGRAHLPPPLPAQGFREPGETLPRRLKQVLRREAWPAFESLLQQGVEVGRPLRVPGVSSPNHGLMEDPAALGRSHGGPAGSVPARDASPRPRPALDGDRELGPPASVGPVGVMEPFLRHKSNTRLLGHPRRRWETGQSRARRHGPGGCRQPGPVLSHRAAPIAPGHARSPVTRGAARPGGSPPSVPRCEGHVLGPRSRTPALTRALRTVYIWCHDWRKPFPKWHGPCPRSCFCGLSG